MLACCGIDCSECAIYKAANDPEGAVRLAESWRAGGHPEAKPEWFRCQGCHGDRSLRWTENCQIASCCDEKGLQNCGECDEFPCSPYEKWAESPEHHRLAYERLKAMRTQSG